MKIGQDDNTIGVKLYEGAYTYYQQNTIYSEENFVVFRDRKEHSMIFISELHSRVSTGELLSIVVNYTVNKDYIPTFVKINKVLGSDQIEETYSYETRQNKLIYTHRAKSGEITERELSTSPKFHIAVPSTCNSMLFLRSKKFDSTSKNVYGCWSSKNQWEYLEDPKVHSVAVDKISQTFETLEIEEQKLQALEYKMYHNMPEHNDKNKNVTPDDYVRVYLSKHITIPYMIKDISGSRVQIKFLKHLE